MPKDLIDCLRPLESIRLDWSSLGNPVAGYSGRTPSQICKQLHLRHPSSCLDSMPYLFT